LCIPNLEENLRQYWAALRFGTEKSFVAPDQSRVVASDAYKEIPTDIGIFEHSRFDASREHVRNFLRLWGKIVTLKNLEFLSRLVI
jgi:hypothetical protein